MQELSHSVTSKTVATTSLPETRVLVLYTGGTIGMKTIDGGGYGAIGY